MRRWGKSEAAKVTGDKGKLQQHQGVNGVVSEVDSWENSGGGDGSF